MSTLDISQKQGGPNFEKDCLFEVRIRGSLVDGSATPSEVLEIAKLLMLVQVGKKVPKNNTYADVFNKMICLNIIP